MLKYGIVNESLQMFLNVSFLACPCSIYGSVLNNTNAVHVASTEMECLATLSKFFKMNRSLEEAINATKQGEPVCKSYLNSIAQRYCGGIRRCRW